MEKGELKRIKKSIRKFLTINKPFLEIQYNNHYLNPTKYYHRALASHCIHFLFKLIIVGFTTILPASEFKNHLLRLIGMKIGKDVSISISVMFDLGFPELITIEDGVIIGTQVKILTHETTIKRIRIGRVHIKKRALIGVRSVIRSGTTIGAESVVGVLSFVNRDVKDKEFVGGIPIKRIKMLKKLI